MTMGCPYLEMEGRSCLLDNVDQGLMKNRQIDLSDRKTKEPEKICQSFSPLNEVTRNLSANNPKKNFGNVLAKLWAFRCHRS